VSERADLYFSADIEADGPIPGPYSMLSFGLAVAGRFDGDSFERAVPEAATFYRELQPISADWHPEALEVSGLDRDSLIEEGTDPEKAMNDAATWVSSQAGKDRAVLVAFPLGFDWMFIYWYFMNFASDGSPFDFSSALDMKTMLARREGVVLDRAGKGDIPPALRSNRPHTHNALDDAIEQAELFGKLW
jgi:hypothetical protein